VSDPHLDERLARAGERFRADPSEPPSLESMLDVATRPQHDARRRLAVAASVLAVAAIAVAVPLTRTSRGDHHSTGLAAGPPPATITQGHTTLHYVGDEAWRDPVLDESSASTVYVYAEVQPGGTASWGSYCDVHPVARIVSQTATRVTVAVGKYAAPPSSDPAAVGCYDIKLGAARLVVDLAAPLGTRSLIDARDGSARQVLDPATVLKPSYLPRDYTGGQATWAEDSPLGGSAGAAVRTYRGPGSTLTVTVGPAPLAQRAVHVVDHTTVRGHPATVSYSPGFEQDILIAWNEDAVHAANLYQTSNYNRKNLALTMDQLLRVANSLR
jgi:hypothetical protein